MFFRSWLSCRPPPVRLPPKEWRARLPPDEPSGLEQAGCVLKSSLARFRQTMPISGCVDHLDESAINEQSARLGPLTQSFPRCVFCFLDVPINVLAIS